MGNTVLELGRTMKIYIFLTLFVAAQAEVNESYRLEGDHNLRDTITRNTTNFFFKFKEMDELLKEVKMLKDLIKNVTCSGNGTSTTYIDQSKTDISGGDGGHDNSVRVFNGSTPNCCTEYKFVPTYDRCADCHYASWYKPRLNDTTSKIRCIRTNDKNDACSIFEHHERLVEEIRCNECKYVMTVDGKKNQRADLDPNTCKCKVVKGEVRDLEDSPFKQGPDGITLKDIRGNPVSAGVGRDWTSIPKFRVAKDATRLTKGFKTEEVINMVCDDVKDTSSCRVEISIIKNL